MTNELVCALRHYSPDEHLCGNCENIFQGVEDDIVRTTQDPHICPYAYTSWKTKDNGMGYWVTECLFYMPLNTKRIYKTWIESAEWKDIAKKAIKESGYKCEMCGSGINLCVHHVTYEYLCREDKHPESIVVLCKKCHEKVHKHDIQAKPKRAIKRYQPVDDLTRFVNWMGAKGKVADALIAIMCIDLHSVFADLKLAEVYEKFGFQMSEEWKDRKIWEERREIAEQMGVKQCGSTSGRLHGQE